ncbi:seminase-like [Musca domestica]|uniref:Seminase-like n=1 Tax=Musca domestica TaxID=7370 RepID=A0A1I8NBB4_MUSDO|nr:seminase-like [Musca domestica]
MFLKSVSIVISLAVLSMSSVISSNANGDGLTRIVGGMITTIDQMPYLVQFRHANYWNLFCGGTLIHPEYVVTAAHCFLHGKGDGIVVIGGVSTVDGEGEERYIEKIIVHPEYDPQTMHSDVAVIKLDEPMRGLNIRPIAICSHRLREGDPLQVSGWGQTHDNGEMSEELRTVSMPVSPWAMCEKEYGLFVEKNMFCGSGFEAKGHCLGDSGGPAIHLGELCGVISFAYKCGEVGRTSAFTDVFSVRDFIDGAMKK